MRLLMVVLIVGVALSGCTTDETPNLAQHADGAVITDPQDYSYLETDGSGWHVHDYWGGEDELLLLSQTESMCEGCSRSYGGDHGTPLGWFVPDADHVVPQGTARIHVTANWQIPEGDFEGVGLFVRTAKMNSAEFVGRVNEGETFTFNSTNDDNDPPHQTLSLWEFELRAMSPDGDGSSVQGASAELVVRVERGLEIPEWPPHADFWGGANTLTLADYTHEVVFDLRAGIYGLCGNCVGGPWLADGSIVPYDTDEVRVEIDVQPGGAPATLGLMAHGSNTRQFSEIDPIVDEPLRKVWSIDPEIHYGDSPYAKQSLWEFRLFVDQPTAEQGVFAWRGTYDVTVTAHKDAGE